MNSLTLDCVDVLNVLLIFENVLTFTCHLVCHLLSVQLQYYVHCFQTLMHNACQFFLLCSRIVFGWAMVDHVYPNLWLLKFTRKFDFKIILEHWMDNTVSSHQILVYAITEYMLQDD